MEGLDKSELVDEYRGWDPNSQNKAFLLPPPTIQLLNPQNLLLSFWEPREQRGLHWEGKFD